MTFSSLLITLRHLSTALVVLVCASLPLKLFADTSTNEYELKAALIYKLSKFVEWPASATPKNATQFGICILGNDPVGNTLKSLDGRTVVDQVISVYHLHRQGPIQNHCQMLFISKSEGSSLDEILKSVDKKPVLTIGDSKDFAKSGGMIQFATKANRISFEINLASAKRSRIKIASQLLSLATIVNSVAEEVNE